MRLTPMRPSAMLSVIVALEAISDVTGGRQTVELIAL